MTHQRKRRPGDGHRLRYGYFARCPRCGETVVTAASTGLPFHMHWRSKKCRERGKQIPITDAKEKATTS